MAWQRQPPKSCSRLAQERQGSCIQSVPRYAKKAGERCQISSRLWLRPVSREKSPCSPLSGTPPAPLLIAAT